jgi:hydroxymethylbilane synthase
MSAPRARLRLGTRGSPLALWQARDVAARLGARGVCIETVVLRTSGDADLAWPLDAFESDAPFADALFEALRSGAIDAAVHSLKDLSPSGPAVTNDATLRGSRRWRCRTRRPAPTC